MAVSSVQPQSLDGRGSIVNTRSFDIVIQKKDGSSISLGPKRKLASVLEEEFKTLPAGVVFLR